MLHLSDGNLKQNVSMSRLGWVDLQENPPCLERLQHIEFGTSMEIVSAWTLSVSTQTYHVATKVTKNTTKTNNYNKPRILQSAYFLQELRTTASGFLHQQLNEQLNLPTIQNQADINALTCGLWRL
jgi:hypothetical protein